MEWVFRKLLSVDLLAYWPPFPQNINLPIQGGGEAPYTDAVCAWAGFHRPKNSTGVVHEQTIHTEPKKTD